MYESKRTILVRCLYSMILSSKSHTFKLMSQKFARNSQSAILRRLSFSWFLLNTPKRKGSRQELDLILSPSPSQIYLFTMKIYQLLGNYEGKYGYGQGKIGNILDLVSKNHSRIRNSFDRISSNSPLERKRKLCGTRIITPLMRISTGRQEVRCF